MKINKKITFSTPFIKTSEKAGEEKKITIRGMASTNDKDRAGDVITGDAWTKNGGLDNFEKNPIILFNHNYDRPVGRATEFSASDKGLELEADINKLVDPQVAEAISEGLLNAFSVGCMVKDADYDSETDIFVIKEAELLEVSVVSIPCNQNATFNVAKSFESDKEFEEFKKTFTGQTSASADAKVSLKDSNSPEQPAKSGNKDKKMDELELEAFAKKVADETATKIAMQQAEKATADEAAAKEAAEAEKAAAEKAAAEKATIEGTIRTGIESGVEKLQADMAKDAAASGSVAETIKQYQAEIDAVREELKAFNDSKVAFARPTASLEQFKKEYETELLHAHILGLATGKGWGTDYAKQLFEKAAAGGSWGEDAGTLFGTTISTAIEREIQYNLTVAPLFREIPVTTRTTVLPFLGDTTAAQWQAGSVTANGGSNVGNLGGTAGVTELAEITLKAYRLISQSFVDNDVDETGLIAMLPILSEQIARAHAKAVDAAFVGTQAAGGTAAEDEGGAVANAILGLIDVAEVGTTETGGAGATGTLTAQQLFDARKQMGKYGIRPADVTYIVSPAEYYALIDDPEFMDVDQVGNDMAAKRTGTMGAVYGSNIVVSPDLSEAGTAGEACAVAVYRPNYVIPRLRGVTLATDNEVGNQRTVIVGHQSLGFQELVDGGAQGHPCVRVNYAT